MSIVPCQNTGTDSPSRAPTRATLSTARSRRVADTIPAGMPSSSAKPTARAVSSIVTVVGLQIGILLGGTVVVEEVFTLPGVGRLVLWSIYQRDYPLTQSTILFVAVMFMSVNLAVDLLYAYLDPRVRY